MNLCCENLILMFKKSPYVHFYLYWLPILAKSDFKVLLPTYDYMGRCLADWGRGDFTLQSSNSCIPAYLSYAYMQYMP